MSNVVVTAPTVEPVGVDEVRDHARISIHDDDPLIALHIKAAREYVTESIQRALINTTYRLRMDSWCDKRYADGEVIRLPMGPVSSVSSVQYVDPAGTTTTLSASGYVVDTDSRIARLYPGYCLVWPPIRVQRQAVTVTYVAGYGATSASVPECIRRAICLLASHWYENREPVSIGNIVNPIPYQIESLLSLERCHLVTR